VIWAQLVPRLRFQSPGLFLISSNRQDCQVLATRRGSRIPQWHPAGYTTIAPRRHSLAHAVHAVQRWSFRLFFRHEAMRFWIFSSYNEGLAHRCTLTSMTHILLSINSSGWHPCWHQHKATLQVCLEPLSSLCHTMDAEYSGDSNTTTWSHIFARYLYCVC
jgi:hypothetical protein